jgi:hypothetical protein
MKTIQYVGGGTPLPFLLIIFTLLVVFAIVYWIYLLFRHRIPSFWLRRKMKRSNWDTPQEEEHDHSDTNWHGLLLVKKDTTGPHTPPDVIE